MANNTETLTPKVFSAKKTEWNEVHPFTQQPSANQFPGASTNKVKEPEVTELFSRFTADIIREDTNFTR